MHTQKLEVHEQIIPLVNIKLIIGNNKLILYAVLIFCIDVLVVEVTINIKSQYYLIAFHIANTKDIWRGLYLFLGIQA